ncbi:hypothetical protein A2706_01575 [Candidatus Peribacteria bacterium RIFCSPHIGHO2_01_FULL_51_35]|nr:MAG: hypothetical protein A2706_01575 [Candidatus Peribacteria bacterium RIFCSPHIGHO2_01_FULL_51_35]
MKERDDIGIEQAFRIITGQHSPEVLNQLPEDNRFGSDLGLALNFAATVAESELTKDEIDTIAKKLPADIRNVFKGFMNG